MFALGIFFFFFIAKILLFAFLAAALFGTVFFMGRKVLGYSHRRPQMPVWKGDMLVDYPISMADRRRSERIIEVQ